jgi:hypothetical protein
MSTNRTERIGAALGGGLLVRYDRDGDERASDAVFQAVEASGVDLFDVDRRLEDVVNSDGLDRLFRDRSGGLVSFECWDRRIVVRPSTVLVFSAD